MQTVCLWGVLSSCWGLEYRPRYRADGGALCVCCLQTGDLIGNLITSAAEVPGLIFSLFMIHYCSRKLAFSVPMGAIPIILIPVMAGERVATGCYLAVQHVVVLACLLLRPLRS